MTTVEAGTAGAADIEAGGFGAFSSGRLLLFCGILFVLAGMIFGDVFAVFVLHPNAGRIQDCLSAAAAAVQARRPDEVQARLAEIGSLLENRGTKVDAHVHLIDFGYLALLLGLVQPCLPFREKTKLRWAKAFVAGAVVLPVSVFLIHYVGLDYSPLQAIGWASIAADLGGFVVLVATAAMAWGVWRHVRRDGGRMEFRLSSSPAERLLLAGGAALILLGFVHGAWYAGTGLYQHEAQDTALLRTLGSSAAAGDMASAGDAVRQYGNLQAARAVNIAAHSHAITFGVLAMLLAFAQRFVFLREQWRTRWAVVLLTGSLILPVFVLAELRWGLVAGGFADLGGFLIVIALGGMLVGIIRETGRADHASLTP